MENQNTGIQIQKKSFFSSFFILFALMMAAGVLGNILPSGRYERILVDGKESIVDGTFKFIEAVKLPIYRWFTAPIEVLWSVDAATVIVILLFVLLIGASFSVLQKSGILNAMLEGVIRKYAGDKYRLLAVICLCFMLFGSLFGLFEELVALIPMALVLSYGLGWDALVGLGMSTLASGFGFAAAIFNPFTVGIAQKLAGLPAFSGVLFRIIVFIVIYLCLIVFLTRYAKKIEKHPELSLVRNYQKNPILSSTVIQPQISNPRILKGAKIFLGFMGAALAFIILSFFIPGGSDYVMPAIAVLLLTGTLVSANYSKASKHISKDFFHGLLDIAPAGILILMAMSVKLIIANAQVLDTVIYYAFIQIKHLNPVTAGLALYAIVLVLEVFIASGSAKAFLVLPIIIPLTGMIGVTRQSAVQAYLFGDGFSNLLYPTNAVLMISLGLANIGYPTWLKWTWKLQAVVFGVSVLFLIGAILMKYGPF
ncbi:MAG: hypothetical protein WBL80_07080 [Erysipelotrichaceae bacterium]